MTAMHDDEQATDDAQVAVGDDDTSNDAVDGDARHAEDEHAQGDDAAVESDLADDGAGPEADSGGDEHEVHEQSARPLGDLDDLGHEAGVEPEDGVAASLQSALVALREQADEVASMPASKPDEKVTAAESVADAAADLDEQIGAIARRDEE